MPGVPDCDILTPPRVDTLALDSLPDAKSAELIRAMGDLATLDALLLPCLAASNDASWDDAFERARTAVDGAGVVEPDVAFAFEQAGRAHADGERHAEARVAWAEAVSQWQRAGRAADADRVSATIAALSD